MTTETDTADPPETESVVSSPRVMRELASVDDLDRGLVVHWQWPETDFYKDVKYRPVGIVITRTENPFGLFHGKYHIRLLDCEWWEFPPEEVFKRGRKLYA